MPFSVKEFRQSANRLADCCIQYLHATVLYTCTICSVRCMLSIKVLEIPLLVFLEFNIGKGVSVIGVMEHGALERLPKCVVDAPEFYQQGALKYGLMEALISFMVGDICVVRGASVCAIPDILYLSGNFPINLCLVIEGPI